MITLPLISDDLLHFGYVCSVDVAAHHKDQRSECDRASLAEMQKLLIKVVRPSSYYHLIFDLNTDVPIEKRQGGLMTVISTLAVMEKVAGCEGSKFFPQTSVNNLKASHLMLKCRTDNEGTKFRISDYTLELVKAIDDINDIILHAKYHHPHYPVAAISTARNYKLSS